jgi:hypothetical protein
LRPELSNKISVVGFTDQVFFTLSYSLALIDYNFLFSLIACDKSGPRSSLAPTVNENVEKNKSLCTAEISGKDPFMLALDSYKARVEYLAFEDDLF